MYGVRTAIPDSIVRRSVTMTFISAGPTISVLNHAHPAKAPEAVKLRGQRPIPSLDESLGKSQDEAVPEAESERPAYRREDAFHFIFAFGANRPRDRTTKSPKKLSESPTNGS